MVFKGVGSKDNKMIKKKKVKEEEEELVKKKRVASVATAVAEKEKKREKKVYVLPGQKHDPPEEVRIAFLKSFWLFCFFWNHISICGFRLMSFVVFNVLERPIEDFL